MHIFLRFLFQSEVDIYTVPDEPPRGLGDIVESILELVKWVSPVIAIILVFIVISVKIFKIEKPPWIVEASFGLIVVCIVFFVAAIFLDSLIIQT